MLDKTYDSSTIESQIIKKWDDAGAFKAGVNAKVGAEAFSIVIPPPNVTGSLHMGHALNATLQDILVRFERMRGKDVLWQPGMDHAGIATQMVVERKLAAEKGLGRREMGRDGFVKKIWEWKVESGGMIAHQLKRLGASCDWSRERFTMDEGLSRAVTKVFVTLYQEGIIYKDKRLVNWDPKLLTAISDMEVESVEIEGSLYYIRYPLEPGVTYDHIVSYDDKGIELTEQRDYIIVATTRPETMLGDTAIAVHPGDIRYQNLVGKHVILPLTGRRIPIIADEYPDPEAGTGIVKMTPAHDFNDFDVGRRHNLPMITILSPEGKIDIETNEAFLEGLCIGDELRTIMATLQGQDRFVARTLIIDRLQATGLLDKIEPHRHMVPHGDRSAVPIEPRLMEQWYVNNKALADPALAAVRAGRTQFIPKNWEKTYFHWLENIEPWCISRQLWWGHQIPAWYGPDGHIFVEKTEEEAVEAAILHYRSEHSSWKAWLEERLEQNQRDKILTRDEDVLDTWFSSALWPFSTLGWPDQTFELSRYYPTNILVTGFDIIPFWVVRMMQMGLHFIKNAAGQAIEPFHKVYVHALVLDKHGQKMSKTKGNVIDPLDLIAEYGADALRFTLTIMAAQGRDIRLDPSRISGYRNFGTKLWNATRFSAMNGATFDPDFVPQTVNLVIHRWILTELTDLIQAVTAALESCRFNDAANMLYSFVWDRFCDWYLELLKPVFNSENEAEKSEARSIVAYILEQIYKLLHPIMPFMTEELWAHRAVGDAKGDISADLLCHASWPEAYFEDKAAADEISWLIDLVTVLRSIRAEMHVPASALVPLIIVNADRLIASRLTSHEVAIKRLARIEDIALRSEVPEGAVQIVIGEVTACLLLQNVIDFAVEKERLGKALAKIEAEIEKITIRLANENFVTRAKAELVELEREKRIELLAQAENLQQAIARLG